MQDSWIDEEEFDELMQVVSPGKKNSPGRPRKSKPEPPKREVVAAEEAEAIAEDKKVEVQEPEIVAEESELEIVAEESEPEIVAEESEPEIVAEESEPEIVAEESEPEIVAEELPPPLPPMDDVVPVITNPPIDMSWDVEIADDVVISEEEQPTDSEEEFLIAGATGSVVFVEESEQEDAQAQEESKTDFQLGDDWEVETAESSDEETSLAESEDDEFEWEGEFVPPLLATQNIDLITLEEDEDLVSEEPDSEPIAEQEALAEKERERLQKEEQEAMVEAERLRLKELEVEASKALLVLAAARETAEKAELMRRMEEVSDAEEEDTHELKVEDSEPEAELEEVEELLIAEKTVIIVEEETVDVVAECEESTEAVEELVVEELLPLPELDFAIGGSMPGRLAVLANFFERHTGGRIVQIRDDIGFPLFEGESSDSDVDFSQSLAKEMRVVTDLAGGEVEYCTQVPLPDGRWLCLLSGASAAGEIILQALLDEPLPPLRQMEFRERLTDSLVTLLEAA